VARAGRRIEASTDATQQTVDRVNARMGKQKKPDKVAVRRVGLQ
jgi:hypothetical protein